MSKAMIGRLILEAGTGMHGEEAKLLSDAWCDMARNNEELQSRIAELEKDAGRLHSEIYKEEHRNYNTWLMLNW